MIIDNVSPIRQVVVLAIVAAVAATPPHGGKQAAKLSNFYLTSLGIATPVAHVQLRRSLHREVERALARNAP